MLWNLSRGESALIVDVPHAGTFIPADIAQRLTTAARAVPDTDWHVDRLMSFASEVGATFMCATHSRYVVDLNRDPSGAALYAGADNTELCPTRTFADAPIYGEGAGLAPDEQDARRKTYFDPYHAALAGEVERVHARHGYVVLLDAHSIPAHVPRFFAGRLPDLNLGTADGASCAPALAQLAAGTLATTDGFSHIVNGRFKGGWITRHYADPARGVHTLQLEIAQACYMNEAPPYAFDAQLAQPLIAVLRQLVAQLSLWRPDR